jgi:hypothetical protein
MASSHEQLIKLLEDLAEKNPQVATEVDNKLSDLIVTLHELAKISPDTLLQLFANPSSLKPQTSPDTIIPITPELSASAELNTDIARLANHAREILALLRSGRR